MRKEWKTYHSEGKFEQYKGQFLDGEVSFKVRFPKPKRKQVSQRQDNKPRTVKRKAVRKVVRKVLFCLDPTSNLYLNCSK